ncbi:T9SS type A sorting domain-containing protein, partial [candidate division KSB1 bacterium]|nr:T9SS type A sorting domain-containing protein [candidate division KSB1 bacterium]
SGNGIPDILDEARNEVDLWLNLRYGKGYSHGLTNPSNENIIYQADNTPIAAWANALNSAMLAFAFEIAGLDEQKKIYLDSAVVAYTYANTLPDPMLDTQQDLGQSSARGRDFKMMAAAYLYNLTGDTVYEDVVYKESVATSSRSQLFSQGNHNQLWGSAAYILTKRDVHYPELQQNIKSSIIYHAKKKEADYVNSRPSRRGYANDGSTAWFQTVQDMPRTLIAHAITDDPAEKVQFLDALLLEADWGLGRNPINTIQMTTATTSLASKRSIENCYTSGRDDGTPGLHPGHTPYLNTESWGGEMAGNNPKKVFEKFYPEISYWPHASKYINSRFLWAHSEFTPRQTMRFKTLLYGYLYGISKSGDTQIGRHHNTIPREFGLLSNYPNPFNNKTKIRYQLPHSIHVAIKIYDIRGVLVETVLNKHVTAGYNEIDYNAIGLASGVYLYSLETNEHKDVKKMLLIK